MKDPHIAEIRHLRPHIRTAMIEGRQKYRNQTKEVALDDGQLERLQRAGLSIHAGGHRHLIARVLTSDTVRLNPHTAAHDANVEG